MLLLQQLIQTEQGEQGQDTAQEKACSGIAIRQNHPVIGTVVNDLDPIPNLATVLRTIV